jgi:RHS repeat-associated protein
MNNRYDPRAFARVADSARRIPTVPSVRCGPTLPASRRDTYDGQGNLATRVDARGVTSTSTYDALDRMTSLVHSKSGSPSETITYTFDDTAVPFSKGRLTKVQDTAGVTSYAYDAFGRVTNKTQIVTGLTRSISRAFARVAASARRIPTGVGPLLPASRRDAYNTLGQLTTMTLPSGAVVTYTYTHGRVSGIGINGSALIQATTYEPAMGNSGAISGWVWGNGLKSYRDHPRAFARVADSARRIPTGVGPLLPASRRYLDGRIATLEHKNGTTLLKNTLSYDSASRITGISNDQQPAKSQAYGYDALDRLTQTKQGANVATPDITQSQAYDANGNRLTQSKGLLNIVAGTYSYNLANRLNEVKQGATVIGSYRFNAFGQRLAKTTANGTQHYVYDEAGQLAGEYDGSGTLVQETVWLENTPVATLRPKAGGGVDVYYVHSDHLNTPRVVTRPIDNKKVWAWHSMPFGETAPDENPEGLGVFAFNLRFPVQEWEAELGLSQNWFRTYAADTGRYVQSDPIGLRGGLNTFGYVGADPLRKVDSTGEAWSLGVGGLGGLCLLAVGCNLSEGCRSTMQSGVRSLASLMASSSSSSAMHDPENLRQRQYEAAKAQCTPPNPDENASCSDLSKMIDMLQEAVDRYTYFDAKYTPGKHTQKIGEIKNRIKKLKERHNKECTNCK